MLFMSCETVNTFMETSESEESFAWTDASSDSSRDNIVGLEMKTNKSKRTSPEQLSETVQTEQKQKGKKRKHLSSYEDNDFQVNKSIKSEPNSDFEVPKGNKKRKHEISKNSLHEAEDYLNLRVKEEQATFVEPSPVESKKKKKLKNELVITADQQLVFCTPSKQEIQTEQHHVNGSCLANEEHSEISEIDISSKKKKKKKKKRLSVENDNSGVSEEPEDRCTSETKRRQRADSDCGGELEHEPHTPAAAHNNHLTSFTATDRSGDDNLHSVSTLGSCTILNGLNSGGNEDSSKKASRISDRIQFEEDSIDYELIENLPKTNLPHELKQFIRCNAHLTPSQALGKSLCELVLSADDEVWIVKGTHEILISDFENMILTLDGKKKVKVNGKSYDSTIDTSTPAVPLLVYHNNKAYIKNTPLTSVISLRNRIPKVHIPYESLVMNNESSFIPLPETKCRHPLFGINYKKAVIVPPEISQRLNTPTVVKSTKVHKIKQKVEMESDTESKRNDEILCSKKKKKKTKERLDVQSDSACEVKHEIDIPMKKKKRKNEKLEIEPEVEVKPEVEVLPSNKKKRKRKHSEGEREAAGGKKAKREKHEPSGADAWESEQAIEKNLFDF